MGAYERKVEMMMAAKSSLGGAAARSRELTTGGIWKGALLGAAAGAVVNSILYVVASAAGTSMVAEFAKGQEPIAMPFPPVVIATFIPAIFAALFAMALNQLMAKPVKAFVAVSVVFGLLSMGGPATIGAASPGLKILLAAMHVVAGVAIAGGIVRLGRSSRPA